jgi:hypothetical protein
MVTATSFVIAERHLPLRFAHPCLGLPTQCLLLFQRSAIAITSAVTVAVEHALDARSRHLVGRWRLSHKFNDLAYAKPILRAAQSTHDFLFGYGSFYRAPASMGLICARLRHIAG